MVDSESVSTIKNERLAKRIVATDKFHLCIHDANAKDLRSYSSTPLETFSEVQFSICPNNRVSKTVLIIVDINDSNPLLCRGRLG